MEATFVSGEEKASRLLASLQAAQAKLFSLAEACKDHVAPKAHTVDEFEELSAAGQRTARFRDIKFIEAFLGRRTWRAADWATALARHGLLDELWESKEVWRFRMEWGRELFSMCMGQHWGTKLGLYLALTEHMPTRQVLRIAQVCQPAPLRMFRHSAHLASRPRCAITPMRGKGLGSCGGHSPYLIVSSKDYNAETHSYHPRVLMRNPYAFSDVLYVHRIFPSITKFGSIIHELTSEHKLAVSAEGRIAYQSLEAISSTIARHTAKLFGVPLEHFSSPDKA
eukprot:6198739-Pleurochrysis_carterae.AAC.1